MNELVTIEFYGDMIVCVKDTDGVVWVSVKRLCENMGISNQGQQLKLEKDPKYVCQHMLMHDATGRKQDMFLIRMDKVKGWLFSINSKKIRKPEIRAKLAQYQDECMQVLNDYWTKGIAVNPRTLETLPAGRDINIPALVEQIKDALTPLIQSLVDGIHKQARLAWDDKESQLRTTHSKRIVEALKPIAVSGNPEYQSWAFGVIKSLVTEDLNPYSYFKLYEIFTAINPTLTKEEAQALATKFRKLEEVQAYERGQVTENYGDRVYMVKRYERRDWDALRDLAITWMREKKFGKGQTGLFSSGSSSNNHC